MLSRWRAGLSDRDEQVEDPVRDAIAYFMHERVSTSGHKVAREYQSDATSRDLAVLDAKGAAVVELEAKAMYSFNVINRPDELLTGEEWHGGDFKKLHAAIAREEACFLLSLVTHLMARVPDELLLIIKYARKSGQHNDVLGRQFAGSSTAMYEGVSTLGRRSQTRVPGFGRTRPARVGSGLRSSHPARLLLGWATSFGTCR